MHKKILIILLFSFLFFSNIPSYARTIDNGKFRFAVFGCVHLGECAPEDYELAVKKIKQCHPDFVLLLGGMIDITSQEPLVSLWRKFDRITDKLGVPVYNIYGNCVISEVYPSSDIMTMNEKLFLDRYHKLYYSFKYKNNLFICLDSEAFLHPGKNSVEVYDQIAFLKNALAEAYKYNSVFLATHHSLWLKDGGEENEWLSLIHPLIKEKVRYVFGANMHLVGINKIDSVNYITTGFPPCYKPYSAYPIQFFFHFLIVDVDKDGVSINIVPVDTIPLYKGNLQGDEEKILFVKEPYYVLTSPEREAFLKPEQIIKTLKIKPGMHILDIGAGKGLFTFPFAEALGNTGMVFATDTESGLVEYIKKRADEYKYRNIFPVQVEPNGVDPFYKQHSFDIIFLSEVFQFLRKPTDYFRELRPSLKKEKGRLYIIHFKNVSGYDEAEFDDLNKIIKILISKGEDFPVFQRLNQKTKYLVKHWRDRPSLVETKLSIFQDFNKMLSDRFLLDDLMDYYFIKEGVLTRQDLLAKIIYPTELRLAKWLIVHLDASGVFDRKKKILSPTEKEQLLTLNKILLNRIFHIDKLDLLLRGDDWPPLYLEKRSILSIMKSAGYKFVREYDFLPLYYFLEFKR